MSKAKAYAAKFDRVFDHIDKRLDESLTLEQLSDVAHFSKYHFHRQFSEYVGISAIRYVQLMRLKRASYRLVFNRLDKITDIALDAGFENPESFSRAFKNTFGQSPTGFRRNPAWKPWNERYQFLNRERKQNMEVRIVDYEQTRVAALEHRGAPELVNDSASVFIEWRKASGLSPVQSSKTFGIVYDNPETTAPEKFRFDICGSVTEDVPPNRQGVIGKEIPAGRCAVVRHLGSHARIGDSVRSLYRDWLPESGEELRDFPLYFHYLNLITETPEHDLVTDIYLPLK
jgi:AraC family transcriptional regulator